MNSSPQSRKSNEITSHIVQREVQRLNVPDCDDLAKVQLVVVDLSDEDGRHSLVERRAVHVYGCTHRQHEADDAPVDVIILQEALKGDRQRGRAAVEQTHTHC